MRAGSEWKPYLEFDFTTMARINRVTIGQPTTVGSLEVRSASRVMISLSRVPDFADNVVMEADVIPGEPVDLGVAIEAQFVKIEILETSAGGEDRMPLAVNGLVSLRSRMWH